MKLNNSFSSNNYYSCTNPNNKTVTYGCNSNYPTTISLKTSNINPRSLSNTRGYPYKPLINNFNTVENPLDSPKLLNRSQNYYQKSHNRLLNNSTKNCDRVNQTITPCYNRDEFQSLQVSNHIDNRFDDFERALSYNIIK